MSDYDNANFRLATETEPEDYTGEDGLLYCGSCRQPKEASRRLICFMTAVGKLTAEYGKIGGNLNQIARCLNEYGAPYNALSQEVRAATAELAALKFEVLQKVGEAVGNVQTYQL